MLQPAASLKLVLAAVLALVALPLFYLRKAASLEPVQGAASRTGGRVWRLTPFGPNGLISSLGPYARRRGLVLASIAPLAISALWLPRGADLSATNGPGEALPSLERVDRPDVLRPAASKTPEIREIPAPASQSPNLQSATRPGRRTILRPMGPSRTAKRGHLHLAALQASVRRRTTPVAVTIKTIGGDPLAKRRIRTADKFHHVDHHEKASGALTGTLPPGGVIQPLLRREGSKNWTVLPPVTIDGNRWSADLRFGAQRDQGQRYELQVRPFRQRMPLDPISESLVDETSAGRSSVLLVERRLGKAFVWISHVDNDPVSGNETHEVYLQTPVRIHARNLPRGALLGLVIQPVRPSYTDLRWVMPDRINEESGTITGHFGIKGMHNFHEFDISAFVAYPEDFPRERGPVGPRQWDAYETKFLAVSKSLTVVKWFGEFKITFVDDVEVDGKRLVAARLRVSVRGTAERNLSGKEKIWIACVPQQGQSWLAGSTGNILVGGKWRVFPADLYQEGRPLKFELVAIRTDRDPTTLQLDAGWLNSVWQSQNRPEMQITRPPSGAANAQRGARP